MVWWVVEVGVGVVSWCGCVVVDWLYGRCYVGVVVVCLCRCVVVSL